MYCFVKCICARSLTVYIFLIDVSVVQKSLSFAHIAPKDRSMNTVQILICSRTVVQASVNSVSNSILWTLCHFLSKICCL